MFQCADCGSQDTQHICFKHPTFRVKEPGIVVTPRSAEALAEENAKLLLQNREYLDHIEWAWGVIANAGPEGCLGNWKKLDAEWVKIAENWRDKYHEILAKKEKREGLCTNDRDGEKCLKAAGHEGVCEGPQHVWDWKPTYGKRKA